MSALALESPSAARLPEAPPAAPAVRFTIDGDDALEAHLARTCARAVSGIRGLVPDRTLEAVLLGGGYGRGEGGVLRSAEGDRPYNDIEFYVALRGSRHLNELRYRRPLEVLAQILTHQADAEVEFKIASLSEMSRAPISMFSYDLLAGHRQVWGDPRGLAPCSAHRHADALPIGEATRLLLNRCSGLLLAKAQLEREPFTEAAADFVGRNLAKVQLALGDAVLTVAGRYHWSCRERHRRLTRLSGYAVPELDAVRRHHEAGVEFKLRPALTRASRAELAARLEEISSLALRIWLWTESRRLARHYASARAYAGDAINFFPQTSALRNAALNLRGAGPRLLRNRRRRWRNPRERALRSLALLLWEPDALTHPALHHRLQAELCTNASHFEGLVDAYTRLWRRVQ
ncbi:MAG TPA: hypothetical protein VFE31_11740 [Opitutaceae bacterium]|jgi:hypothetical protein|nr:hypothetical protein [Opitutaceae bacterium]